MNINKRHTCIDSTRHDSFDSNVVLTVFISSTSERTTEILIAEFVLVSCAIFYRQGRRI
jgi:hypothetical protein